MTLFFATVFYLAAALFVCGISYKLYQYSRTPSPFSIPVPPAPRTRTGVLLRILREALLFSSLFRASKWTWIFGWLFHYALLVVLVRHLFFATDPVWTWVLWMFPYGDMAAWILMISLLGLWSRRLLIGRIRYISSLSDHLMLALFLIIGASGLILRYMQPTDLAGVRNFVLGMLRFAPESLPQDVVLYIHLGCVALLIAIFPFSKLIHFPSLFFSPGHIQRNAPGQ